MKEFVIISKLFLEPVTFPFFIPTRGFLGYAKKFFEASEAIVTIPCCHAPSKTMAKPRGHVCCHISQALWHKSSEMRIGHPPCLIASCADRVTKKPIDNNLVRKHFS